MSTEHVFRPSVASPQNAQYDARMNIHELIFAHPGPLVVAMAILAAPLAYVSWRHGRWIRALGLAPAAAVAALLLCDALVRTDVELVEDLLAQTMGAMKAKQFGSLRDLLVEDFATQVAGQTQLESRDQAVHLAEAALSVSPVQSTSVRGVRVVGSAGGAEAFVTLRTGGPSLGGSLTRWRVTARRGAAGRWQLDRADLLEYNGQPAHGLTLGAPGGH